MRGKSFYVIEIQQKQRQQQQAFACETYIAVSYECINTHPRPQFHIYILSRFDISRSKYDPGPT